MFEHPNISRTLKSLTVKILNNGEETGTGIIINPKDVPSGIMVVTAKHNLYQKIEDDANDIRSQISIIFYDNNGGILLKHKVSPLIDFVLKSSNNKDDIVGILLNTDNLLVFKEMFPSIQLVKDNGGELNTTFFGFPKVDVEGHIHRINSKHLDCSDSRISLESNVSSEHSLTAESLKGFSGSGIGLISNNNVFLLGIITDYLDLNRFEGVNILLVNKILNDNGLRQIEILDIETEPSLIADAKIINDISNNIIDNIDTAIEDITFERNSLIDEAIIKLKESNLLAIVGDAGVGKSAFSKLLIKRIQAENVCKLITLRGEQICTDSLTDTLKTIGVTNNIDDLLGSKDFIGDIIIYIDSAEKIIENNKFNTLTELIKLSNKHKNIRILLSIRSYAFSQVTTLGLINEHTKKYDIVSIPFLCDEELKLVSGKINSVKQILEIENIKDIVKVPFYLKYIVNHIEDVKAISDINESKLKGMLWEKVIRKSDDAREQLFSKIAIQRLEEIKSNVYIEEVVQSLLEGLLFDNILKEYKNSIGIAFYSPTHDIFEDWALVRHISTCYETRSSSDHFFQTIDKGYAFIRGFRIWVNESLKNEHDANNLKGFLFECLTSKNIDSRWKTEIISAILKSPYSYTFFTDHKEWLLNDNGKNLLWFINTLRVTCRVFPSVKETNQLDDRLYFNTECLLPSGEGWSAILKFINVNYFTLTDHVKVITDLMLDWQSLIIEELPDSSRDVFEIIHKLLPTYIPHFSRRSGNDGDKLHKVLILYLNLVGAGKEEISKLLNEALNSIYTNEKKSRSIGYNIAEYYEFLIKKSLSWMTSKQLCKHIPDSIITISNTVWKIRRKEVGSGYGHDYNERERIFGLSDDHDFQYFPASSKQTFLAHLLNYHPEKGIKYIIELVSYAGNSYEENIKNEGIQRIEIPLLKKDVSGNLRLWDAYRGNASTPYLFESILMTLEDFLLKVADLNSTPDVNHYCRYILINSTNVSSYSVVASICMLYPLKMDKDILEVILSPKEFILWDNTRRASEYSHRVAPIDPTSENPYLQEERYASNNLKHRKFSLEALAFQLSLYEGYVEFIYQIIENHLKQLKKLKKSFEKNAYGLALNRMDRRWYEANVVENDKNVLVEFKPIIKDEYKDFVIQDGDERPDHLQLSTWSWGHQIFDNNKQEENSFENWKKYYVASKTDIDNPKSLDIRLLNYCSGIALIGLKYYLDKLSEEEKDWCIKIAAETSVYFIENMRGGYRGLENQEYGIFNEEPSVHALLHLLLIEEIDKKDVYKYLVKYILSVDFHNGLSPDRFRRFSKELWSIDSKLAMQIVNYLIYLSQLKYERWLEIDELIKDIDLESHDKINIDALNLNFDIINSGLLEKAFYVATNCIDLNESIKSFISWYIDYITAYTNIDHRTSDFHNKNYYNAFSFKKNFSKLLLYGETADLIPLFNKFILIFLNIENVGRINNDTLLLGFDLLKECIYGVDTTDEQKPQDNFMVLWEVLFIQTVKTEMILFSSMLLLKIQWKDSSKNWKLLDKNKDFFSKQIFLFSHYRLDTVIAFISTIGAYLFLYDSISVIANAIRKDANIEWNRNYLSEKMIQLAFTMHETKIKNDQEKKDDFLLILDKMIEKQSAVAYLIRESFIG